MAIQTDELKKEREILVKDFEALSSRIKQVDTELVTMKSNLNAVHGAIQQIDRLIQMSEGTQTKTDEPMPKEKQEALAIATS